MLTMPFPYIANEAGWTVAEVGRQPWVVYGLQRVAHATSTNVTTGMTYFTLLGFMGLYLVLGILYLLLFARIVNEAVPTTSSGSTHEPEHRVVRLLAFTLAVLRGARRLRPRHRHDSSAARDARARSASV